MGLVRKALMRMIAMDLLGRPNKTAQFKDEMDNLLSPNLFAYLGMGSLIPHTQFLKDYIGKFISILLDSHPNYYTNETTDS